jgi:hypothetical protein
MAAFAESNSTWGNLAHPPTIKAKTIAAIAKKLFFILLLTYFF